MSSYKKRKDRGRTFNPKIIIICEGEKTEIEYLNSFKEGKKNIEIIPIYTGCTDIKNMLRNARSEKRSHRLLLNGTDQLWIAFDLDDKNPTDIDNCYLSAEKENIKFAFSNPNIEIWFLLHYNFIQGSLTKEDTKQKWKELTESESTTKDDYSILKDKISQATRNAEKLEKYHRDSNNKIFHSESNPITFMYHLIKEINT